MNRNNTIVIIFICIVEIVCIGWIGSNILDKKSVLHQMLLNTHIAPLFKKTLVFPPDTELRHYYELKPLERKEYDLTFVEASGTAVHTINADGLNERYDYAEKKPRHTYRILTIGDSFTEGMFVDTDKNYSERLEDMLNSMLVCDTPTRFEVVNFGVDGYDMQYSLERYKRKGIKYQADMILLLVEEDDFTYQNDVLYEKTARFERQLEASPSYVQTQKEKKDYYPALTLAFNEYYSELHNDLTPVITKEAGYLRELGDLYTGQIVLFTIDSLPLNVLTPIQQWKEVRQKSYVFPVIHSFDHFIDGHPTEQGHKELSALFYQTLLQESLLPCHYP